MPCKDGGLPALTTPLQGSGDPPRTTGCSLCPAGCRARASTQGPTWGGNQGPHHLLHSAPGALSPKTAIPPWVHTLPSPQPTPAPHKPHTYSQHLQSLCPADPSRSCKPLSHGRASPERRKALTCLQFAPPAQAGREAAGLAQHSLGQSNSPKVQLQLWACNQCFMQPHGRSLGPALMLPVTAGLHCLLNSDSPIVGLPGASQSTLNPAGISSREWQPAQSRATVSPGADMGFAPIQPCPAGSEGETSGSSISQSQQSRSARFHAEVRVALQQASSSLGSGSSPQGSLEPTLLTADPEHRR